MIMIWRSAMPLLTTLAALVIIVHCVEEDLESDYRHDLRPRILDTGTHSNDQPWRAMEETPALKQRHTGNWDDPSPDEAPKRRRPGRKRKRRPQTQPDEEIPQERFAYPDEPPRPYFDVDFENNRQTTEMPKRRRKKPEQRPIRWTDDDLVVAERPLRKRGGGRRKRPSIEKWPTLSEFSDYPNINHEVIVEDKTDPPYPIPTDSTHEENLPEVRTKDAYGNGREKVELMPQIHLEEHRSANAPTGEGHTERISNIRLADDKSLSEFSLESITDLRATKLNTYEDHHPKDRDENRDKSSNNEHNKQESVDPLTLKDILRRSNGTSLSEILQQHNLSLADLLNGKAQAVSIFKTQDSSEGQNKNPTDVGNELPEKDIDIKEDSEEKVLINSETKYATEPVTEFFTTTEINQEDKNQFTTESVTTVKPATNHPKMSTRRRYPTSLRKKLRMRPVLNVTNTHKGQLNRDLIALNARKYSHRRNTNRTKEWRNVIPAMRLNNERDDNNAPEDNGTTTFETTTATIMPEETTTIAIEVEINNSSFDDIRPQVELNRLDDINMDETEATATTEITTEIPRNITEKPVVVVTMARPTAISSGLRRQAFNNRLKRKRLRQKNSTTEPPQDDLIKHLFGMGNLVSSSEFIARTQDPRATRDESNELTTLDDAFATTESTSKTDGPMHVKIMHTRITTPTSIIQSTTEDTAKIEIEEIFNDTITSAKLSRILKERNMTLSELVEHRERGSSHVHLADIFHNASREPNPPEPFLSKSLLEPISKETYPLRAILEANLHDSNGKLTTIDPSAYNNLNIPVVMDFRNNVNENAENMGIMSLFNNYTKHFANTTKAVTDIEENDQKVSDIVQNAINANDTVRESRVLDETEDDVVSWNEIFSLMRRNQNNGTEEPASDQPYKKITIEEDVDADGDGLIVLEDLQHLKDFDNNIALDSNEKLDPDLNNKEADQRKGILDKIPIQTKSVTVATASIVGLAMILFLLTYAAFKWKQQRSMIGKKPNFNDERIPTPVFENRKGHKNNSSSRSISPMLQTSNIYTVNTLDSQHGKESPDYMWDSLRKPFQ